MILYQAPQGWLHLSGTGELVLSYPEKVRLGGLDSYNSQAIMQNILSLLKTRSFLFKILELVLGILVIALIADQFFVSDDVNKAAVGYGTIVGFIMISIIIIVGEVLEYPVHRMLVMVINVSAGLLYLATGSILIETYSNYKIAPGGVLGSGILGLITGVIYLIDLVFTYFQDPLIR